MNGIISILVAIGLAFIPAQIAEKKGYSKIAFWIFGLFFFLPALIVALILKDRN